VEVDETYIGGRHKRKQGELGRKGPIGRSLVKKSVVIGLRQREGPVKMVHVADAKAETIRKVIEAHVSDDVEVILTDDYLAYPIALKKYEDRHLSINHSGGHYVTGISGEIHTNTVESAFSLFKRGIVGSFHHISAKHLHRYLSEFDHRFNRRKSASRFTDLVARSGRTSPLPYRELVGKHDAAPLA
jgi:transposase-like protein